MRSYDDLAAAQKSLHDARARLAALLPSIGAARTALEYDSEAKKIALADAVEAVRAADPEMGQSQAESKARATKEYKEQIRKLYRSHKDAAQTDAEWRLGMADIEIGRTDVSTEKSLAEMT